MTTSCLVLVLACLSACGADAGRDDLSARPFDASAPFTTDGGIACGATTCDITGGNVCCVEPGFQFCGAAEACSAGIAHYCNGPADCPGAACCTVSATTVACATTCAD